MITSPVGLFVPDNTSSPAQTKVMKGAAKETPKMKKTIDHLGVFYRGVTCLSCVQTCHGVARFVVGVRSRAVEFLFGCHFRHHFSVLSNHQLALVIFVCLN